MPDLTMSFMNPRMFDDSSFHPCVRFKRWEVRTQKRNVQYTFLAPNSICLNIISFSKLKSERILSFIPPDGNFRLMSYLIGSQNVVAIPIYVRHNLHFAPNGNGKLDLTVGPKQTMGRQLESVKVEIPMPDAILNCTLTSSQGKYTFDPVSKMLHWEIGKIDPAKLPNLRGTVRDSFQWKIISEK